VLPDSANLRAGFFFRTFAAGFETFGHRALANFAQRVAKQCFGAILSASPAGVPFRCLGMYRFIVVKIVTFRHISKVLNANSR
jgi:hypothetical protein